MENSQETNNALGKVIISMIAFFDLFDFPLTAFEVWKYSSVKCGLGEVQDALRGTGKFEERHGFYFLPGQSRIVATRMGRYNAADRKFRRAALVARMFKFIPWVKLVAVGNMIGGNNARGESDIDLFVVAAAKRIWLTRFFCAGLAKLLMLRPTREKKKDKICLSFYASEDALDLRSLMLGAGMGKDVYFIHWLACLVPVYDAGGTYDGLIAANNWLYDFFPNWRPAASTRWREVKPLSASVYREIVDLWLGGLEGVARKFQLRIMPAALKGLMNKDTRVVVNDKVLKLYTRDRREEFMSSYQASLQKMGRV